MLDIVKESGTRRGYVAQTASTDPGNTLDDHYGSIYDKIIDQPGLDVLPEQGKRGQLAV